MVKKAKSTAKKSATKASGKKPKKRHKNSPNRASSGNKASGLLKKGFLIGLGLTVVTAEKTTEHVKDLVNSLVEQGDLSQKDAKNLGKDIKKLIQDEKVIIEKKVKETVDANVRRIIKSMNLVTRDELNALKKELGSTSKPRPAAAKSRNKSAKTSARPKPKKSGAPKASSKKAAGKKSSAGKKRTRAK